MKQLILFTIMTACCITFAQTQGQADLSRALKSQILSQNALLAVQNLPSSKNIFVMNTERSAQDIMKKALQDQATNQNRMAELRKKTAEMLVSGGWQPEAKALSPYLPYIEEMSKVASCSRANIEAVLQAIPLPSSQGGDLIIDVQQLSTDAQNCLRK